MDWEFLTGPLMSTPSQLLHGCYLEAERADRVAQGLDGLRKAINESLHEHLISLTDLIRQSGVLLRDLAARGHTPHSRTPLVANHLNVVLPCMSKTLRDISAHYQNKTISREIRWKKMYHDMLKDAGGLALPQRFLLYNTFLALLLFLLTRDRRFDPTQLEQLRNKILDLRKLRGIPDPVQQQRLTTVFTAPAAPPAVIITAAPAVPALVGEQQQQQQQQQHLVVPGPRPGPVTIVSRPHDQPQRPHWCERVFSLFAARTDGMAERAVVSAPLVSGHDPRRPVARKVLMRRSFDRNRFCVKFILAGHNEEPCVVLRAYGRDSGEIMVAWKWHNELVAARVDSMVVVLRRWSETRCGWKEWVKLKFVDWEELVLFYTAFVVLKARSPFSSNVGAAEYTMAEEDMLFQAKIVDDDYDHTLMVKRDQRTTRLRLLTAVSTGELAQCPVWTAFIPTRLRITRESRHIVQLRGIQLYVFCQKYRESRMRQNRTGAFEIYFISEQGADAFMLVFRSPDPSALEPPGES